MEGPRARHQLVDELARDVLVHEQAGRRRAPLPAGPEGAPDGPLDREIHVCVLQHEDRVLAAHFEMKALEGRRGGGRDPPADLG